MIVVSSFTLVASHDLLGVFENDGVSRITLEFIRAFLLYNSYQP